MIVPLQETKQQAFLYLLKKKLEKEGLFDESKQLENEFNRKLENEEKNNSFKK